jgi:hypothetical protein
MIETDTWREAHRYRDWSYRHLERLTERHREEDNDPDEYIEHDEHIVRIEHIDSIEHDDHDARIEHDQISLMTMITY